MHSVVSGSCAKVMCYLAEDGQMPVVHVAAVELNDTTHLLQMPGPCARVRAAGMRVHCKQLLSLPAVKRASDMMESRCQACALWQ